MKRTNTSSTWKSGLRNPGSLYWEFLWMISKSRHPKERGSFWVLVAFSRFQHTSLGFGSIRSIGSAPCSPKKQLNLHLFPDVTEQANLIGGTFVPTKNGRNPGFRTCFAISSNRENSGPIPEIGGSLCTDNINKQLYIHWNYPKPPRIPITTKDSNQSFLVVNPYVINLPDCDDCILGRQVRPKLFPPIQIFLFSRTTLQDTYSGLLL